MSRPQLRTEASHDHDFTLRPLMVGGFHGRKHKGLVFVNPNSVGAGTHDGMFSDGEN